MERAGLERPGYRVLQALGAKSKSEWTVYQLNEIALAKLKGIHDGFQRSSCDAPIGFAHRRSINHPMPIQTDLI